MPSIDFPSLGVSAAGAVAATVATIAWTGFAPSPAPPLAAAFVGGAAAFLALEVARRGFAAPAVLFALGVAYYHIIVPVEYLIDPELPRSLLHEYPSLTEKHLVLPLAAADVALFALIAGYAFVRDAKPVAPFELDERRLTIGALGLVGVGVALYLTMSTLATGSLLGIFSTTYRERDELFYGLGALGVGIDFVYVGLTCLAVSWLARGGVHRSALAVGLCAMMGLHSFLVGSKLHVFHVGVGTLAGSGATGRRIRPGFALGMLVVLAVPLLFVGLARNKQGEGLGEMATFVEEETDADQLNPANIDAWGPYLTLVHTCATLRIPEDLKWGSTYTQAVTLLPPRFLYPNRPRPADEEFAEEFLGRDYYDNAGFGYSAVTEGYANFGWPGIALAFLGAGLALGALRDGVARRRGSLASAIIIATASPWIALAVREQAAGMVKGYGLMTLAPTLAVLRFAKRKPV